MPSSRGSSQPRDQTCVSHISCSGKRVLNHLVLPGKPSIKLHVICVSVENSSLSEQNLAFKRVFPGGSEGKVSACNVGDPGLIPGSGSSPGEGNGNPLQHSHLENSKDGGAW